MIRLHLRLRRDRVSAIRVLICIAAALVVGRCDDGSAPTSPSTVTPGAVVPLPPPASFPTLTMNLTGTVSDADGRPVADATVRANPFIPGAPRSEPVTTTTGATGRYELRFENGTAQSQGGGAVASKPGYEDAHHYVVPAANAVQDFRLHPITRVAPGTTLRVTLLPDEGFCGFSDEWRCRKFRVVSPTSGTLTVTATTAAGAEGGYLEIVRPYRCCRPPMSIPVEANEEIRVNVLMDWTSPVAQTFVLQTSLN